MGVDFSTLDYLPNYDMFSRPVTFAPLVSQPGGAGYAARGIYSTRELDVQAEDGSVVTDHQTILDIREAEFGALPIAGDRVIIPADSSGPALGEFEIINVWHDGGGETTLQLRIVPPMPIVPPTPNGVGALNPGGAIVAGAGTGASIGVGAL